MGLILSWLAQSFHAPKFWSDSGDGSLQSPGATTGHKKIGKNKESIYRGVHKVQIVIRDLLSEFWQNFRRKKSWKVKCFCGFLDFVSFFFALLLVFVAWARARCAVRGVPRPPPDELESPPPAIAIIRLMSYNFTKKLGLWCLFLIICL